MSLIHAGFILLFFILLILGFTWMYYAKRIIDWLWPKQLSVLGKMFNAINVNEAPFAKASHLSQQKRVGVWLYRIGGIMMMASSVFFLYILLTSNW
jgi:hypothetical protein